MTLQLEEKRQKLGIGSALAKYPRLVNGEAFGALKRIRARSFGMAQVDDQIFLGYCTIHLKYFLDLIHTNEVIRCPICDKEWLAHRKPTYY
ncbi:MAG: hypothetical protein QG670_601 [Thermoproteota archaeon]|nr:hypothetical protein [Thermoproteota archaeon]